MAFDWAEFIGRHRKEIIEEWARRLHTEVNKLYAERPIEELYGTVGRALDANCSAIIHGDRTLINRFINKISRVRLAGGFSINDVLMAFELFRTVILPRLNRETTREELYECFIQVNECLTYTHLCFIEFFQELHKQEMVDYTRRLEEDVKARTSELLESERKYKTLIEEINDGYVILQDEVIVFVNRAFCEMHELPSADLLGKRFDLFVDSRDRGEVSDLCRGNESSERMIFPLEYHRLTHSGKSLPTEITVKSTCYGRNRCTIGICRDITERVTMAAKMRDAERMAYIGRITTSLSHEIRNPLSAMKMNLQILKRNLNLQGNDRRRLDISLREMQRLEGILEQLLDFAKPLLLKRCPCDLNRFLPSCVELLESRFEEHHLSVHLHLDPAVPEISADPDKLERAIVNLLINALEASEPHGHIDVFSASHRGETPRRVEFRVENQGIIPDEVLPDVFKPFFTTKAKGTGLGLTNVKRVVEAHGGSVGVEQNNRSKTVVRVCLPAGDIHG
jgi:PAS domain S-box-containing protein